LLLLLLRGGGEAQPVAAHTGASRRGSTILPALPHTDSQAAAGGWVSQQSRWRRVPPQRLSLLPQEAPPHASMHSSSRGCCAARSLLLSQGCGRSCPPMLALRPCRCRRSPATCVVPLRAVAALWTSPAHPLAARASIVAAGRINCRMRGWLVSVGCRSVLHPCRGRCWALC
jgi:hypothetical protein